MKGFLNWLFEWKVILNCAGLPYLHRWYVLRTGRVAVFIHRFVRSDEDWALHDHPWDFVVIPVWRGYYEWYAPSVVGPLSMRRRVWPLLGTRFRRAEFQHRVELRDGRPAWSLFIRFRRRRAWGFQLARGWTSAREWWAEFCE